MVASRGVDSLEHQIIKYFAKVVHTALIRVENQRAANLFMIQSAIPENERKERDKQEYEKAELFFIKSIMEINDFLDDLPFILHKKIISGLLEILIANARTKPSGQVSNSYIDYHWRPDYKLEIPDNHQLTDTPQGPDPESVEKEFEQWLELHNLKQANGEAKEFNYEAVRGQGTYITELLWAQSNNASTSEVERVVKAFPGVPGVPNSALRQAWDVDRRQTRVKEYYDNLKISTCNLPGLDELFHLELDDEMENSSGVWHEVYGTLRQKTNPTLRSLISVICKESSQIVDLSPLTDLGNISEDIRRHFSTVLIKCIPKMIYLRELNLENRHANYNLPQIDNEHVKLIGIHCKNLEILNISFHKSITKEGFAYLGGNKDPEIGNGCFKLVKLYIYDISVYEKEVAKLVIQLPNLRFLGYKETGKVIRTLDKYPNSVKINITHVDNRGSKARRLDYSALRCKRSLINAMVNVVPNVANLKLRVTDDDVAGLVRLDHVATVELVYHCGSIQSPSVGTHYFMQVRGTYLTSLALTCQNMSVATLKEIAKSCVKLQMLWYRSNHFTPNTQDELPVVHDYLTNLHTLYLRVGNNELYVVSNFPTDVIPFLTRNAPLRELIVAIRSNMINDRYVLNLLKQPNFSGIEKILFVIPGVNSIRATLSITDETLEYIINNCSKIKKIGNLLSWNLDNAYKEMLKYRVTDQRWELEIIDKKMTMR